MDDRFYNSFLPPVVKVCGRKLDKFTLWHHFVLSAIGSPIADGGERISVVDLVIAAKVATLKYGESDITPSIKDIWWKRKITKNHKLFKRHAENFYLWMGKQSSPPKFYRENTGGGISKGVNGGSRCLALACSLMHRGGMSELEAWNCTLGKAMWYDAQFAQLEGIELRFVDDDDLDESEIDLSDLSDIEALTKFRKDLPAELVEATFNHWQKNIKRKEFDL